MSEEKKMNQEFGMTRRSFLKTMAVGTVAVGTASVLPASAEAAAKDAIPVIASKKKKGQALAIQTFPYSTTAEFKEAFRIQEEKAATKEELYFHPYSGLFVEAIKNDALSVEREFYTYIPEGTGHCCSSVFVALPNNTAPEKFLVESGWVEVADENKFLLHAMVPAGNKKWGDDAEELAYLAACYAMGTRTVNYSPYTGNYYFVGYSLGGKLLQKYVMTTPDNCSGLVVVDGSSISASYLEEMQQKPAVDPTLSVAQINCPVWIVEKALNSKVKRVINYWKSANEWSGECFIDTKIVPPTTVYPQSMLDTDAFVNAYPIGKVLVTNAIVSYTNCKFTHTMWEQFLCKATRFRSSDGNNLRPAIDFGALGFTKEWRVVDGFHRYWLEFVPKKVRENPDQPAPLVFAMHGAGQCAEAYAPYSEWWKVAAEAGFVVCFPTAYPWAENNGMARPISNDCWQHDGTRNNDLNFWRFMIDDVKSRWNIDAGRVYATGHSNGGNSSAMIAGEMGDVVTACGISAGRYRNYEGTPNDTLESLHPMASDTNGIKMPIMQLVGTADGGAYKSKTMTSTMNYWMLHNECEGPSLKYRAGIYHHQMWLDKKGVPMVRYAVILNKPHTTNPFESRLFWYEFMSMYYRDPVTKEIIFCGDEGIIDAEKPW